MKGPTWAQIDAWCRRNLVDAKRMREDIERHAARDEASDALAELRRISRELADCVGLDRDKFLRLSDEFDAADRRHEEAMRRAYPETYTTEPAAK